MDFFKGKRIFSDFSPIIVNSALLNCFTAKSHFVFTKIFVLRLFKMLANQTVSSLEEKYVMKVFIPEKWQPFEIYHRKYDVYGEAYFC